MSKESTGLKIAHFVLKRKWWIIGANVLLLAIIFAGMGIRGKKFGDHIKYMTEIRNDPTKRIEGYKGQKPMFDSDYRVWFDSEDPNLKAMDEHQAIYNREDILIVLVKSKSGNLWTNTNLQTLSKLTKELWTVDYTNRVDGLANFNYTQAKGDDLKVAEFLSDLPYDAKKLEEKKKLVLDDPLMTKFLMSQKLDMTQITMKIIAPQDFPNAFPDAKASTLKVVEKITQENPDFHVMLAGSVMLNNAFLEFAMNDQKTLVPLMFLFIVITMTLMLRSVVGMLLPMIVLITSIVFPMLLFMGIFGMTREEAIIDTLDKNYLACLLTSVTTAIGFYSLVTQSMPPFRDLGLFAGTGTVYAWFASIFTLPALLAVIPFKQKPKASEEDFSDGVPTKGYEKFVDFIFKYKRSILVIWVISCVVSVVFLFRINVDNNTMAYFDKKSEFRIASDYIDKNILGTMPFEFNFRAGGTGKAFEPEFLQKVEKFTNYLLSKPEYAFTHVSSILDIVKRMNKTMHAEDPKEYRIPEPKAGTDTRKLIAQYMFLYKSNLPQGSDVTNLIDADDSMISITGFARAQTSNEQVKNAMEINAWLDKEMPEMKARAIGIPVMFALLMKQAIPGMIVSMLTSFLLITVSMIWGFKSLKIGLLSMIPNVWPVLFLYGLLGITGYTVDLGVSVVGMITLGIAVDDTIHFLAKFLRAHRSGKNNKEAILHTLRETGGALIMTSVILVVGFGILIFSGFLVNANMGLLSAIIIALALLADFVITPAVLITLFKEKDFDENTAEV
ncbi:MAG: MMPL family transporter [Turneriella sp.]|nr:MMPL family transporter [Turneriella sp.]